MKKVFVASCIAIAICLTIALFGKASTPSTNHQYDCGEVYSVYSYQKENN